MQMDLKVKSLCQIFYCFEDDVMWWYTNDDCERGLLNLVIFQTLKKISNF